MAKSSGLRAPSPAKTLSRKKATRSKEGREVTGKTGAKEKGAGPTFLQRWLTASGGTPEDSSEAGKREGLPGQKEGKFNSKERA